MKPSASYSLHTIAGVPYLLPSGQGIADHQRGVRLNETGVFLWQLLQQDFSKEEILSRFMQHYELSACEAKTAAQDIDNFFEILTHYGILEACAPQAPSLCERFFFRIAGLRIQINGERRFLDKSLFAFEAPSPFSVPADLTVTLTKEPQARFEAVARRLTHKELLIYESATSYHFSFPMSPNLLFASLDKDGRGGCITLRSHCTETTVQEVFHALRLFFLYRAASFNQYVIHSASILYRQKAWIFSASSGTGKSTHTNLWKELFQTPVLNGDLNLLSYSGEEPVIHGIPWCGTSGIFDVDTYPLGGIILLSQGETNSCHTLSEDEKALLIRQRFISPCWNERQLQKQLSFAEKISSTIPVLRYQCTKEDSAAIYMKQTIDRMLLHPSGKDIP